MSVGQGNISFTNKSSNGGTPVTELDLIDIRAFGGVADGVTDNQPAMLAAKASAPAGALIWFKNRSNSIFYFNNTDPTLFDDTKIYVEEGVILKFSTENLQNLNCVTPLTVVLESLDDQPQNYFPQAANITHVDDEPMRDNIVIREPIDANDFVERGTDDWATIAGDTINSIPANLTPVGTNQINITGIAANNMRNGTLPAVPGGTMSACARGTSAWALMWCENSYGLLVCYGGFTVQIRKFGDPDNAIGNQQLGINGELNTPPYLNYGSDEAICSIHLFEDGKTVEFYHNGVNRMNQQFQLGGLPITTWGFGGYGAGGDISWFDFILEYNRKPVGQETTFVQIFGDSQTGNFQGSSWVKYFEQYLHTSYGFRVKQIDNYAVSGQTIEQQKAIFDGVSHRGITILMAGTNNVQGLDSIASMLNALDGFLSALNYQNNLSGATVGTIWPATQRFLLVIPPMYFDYALNGNKGKASVNYQYAGTYWMAMLRWATENNVMVASLPDILGSTTQFADILRDDIHPSDLGAAIMGREIAKKYIALANSVTANKVVVGNDKSSIHFIKSSAAPADPVNAVKWVSIYQGGIEYKTPLYL